MHSIDSCFSCSSGRATDSSPFRTENAPAFAGAVAALNRQKRPKKGELRLPRATELNVIENVKRIHRPRLRADPSVLFLVFPGFALD